MADGEPRLYGDIQVTVVEEHVGEHWNIRDIDISMVGTLKQTRRMISFAGKQNMPMFYLHLSDDSFAVPVWRGSTDFQ